MLSPGRQAAMFGNGLEGPAPHSFWRIPSILEGLCRGSPGQGIACKSRLARVGGETAHSGIPFGTSVKKAMTIFLFLAGLVCFALFFKSIDYFEKI
jgi:hypothetical protein